jgi:hypothetical protein
MRKVTHHIVWSLPLCGALMIAGCSQNSGDIADNGSSPPATSASSPRTQADFDRLIQKVQADTNMPPDMKQKTLEKLNASRQKAPAQ